MTVIKDTAAMAQIVCHRMAVLRQQRGVAGTAVYCARYIRRLPQHLGRLLLETTFDRKMGVQTSRLVAATDLGIDEGQLLEVGRNAGGVAYMPTPAWALPAILEDMNVNYPDYNFIDLGSGMGRVVLIAAEYPFRKVAGVEFSLDLHRTAEDNLARNARTHRAMAVELVCQDVREYTLPPGNCIVYLFNPFQEKVMRTVLDKLKESFNNTAAQLWVIYFNPVLGAILDESSFLVKVKATRHYSIYVYRACEG